MKRWMSLGVVALSAMLPGCADPGSFVDLIKEATPSAGQSAETDAAPQEVPGDPAEQPVAIDSAQRAVRTEAWALGHKLSLAAIGYSEGAPQSSVMSLMGDARILASALGVAVPPPLPRKYGDSIRNSVEALHYLLDTAGKPIGRELAAKHGHDTSLLFETAVKTNLLLILYSDDGAGKEALTITEVLERNATATNIPAELWNPVVRKVHAGASYDEVKLTIVKMHKDVLAYLAPPGAGGSSGPGSNSAPASPQPNNLARGRPRGGARSPSGQAPRGREIRSRASENGGGVVARPQPGRPGRRGGGINAREQRLAAPTDPPPAPTPPTGQEQYLRDLPSSNVKALADQAHPIDRSFAVAQVDFQHGVFLHPPTVRSSAQASYALDGGYARLSGAVGVADHKFRRSMSPLTFKILADGKELWSSQTQLQKCGQWEAFDVDVAGVKELTLLVDCPRLHTGAHGVWLDPKLTRAAGR